MLALPGRHSTKAALPPPSKQRTGWALAVAALLASHALAFDLEGHRGARGLAPENTLAAFRRALAIGVTTIETDVAVTKDLVAVISHNPRLEPDLVRDPDGRWLSSQGPSIHSLTLDQLRRYDIGRLNPASRYARQFPGQEPSDGERFPTLRELFDLVNASGKPVRLDIETKITPHEPSDTVDASTFVRLILAEARRAELLDRVTIQSFDWRTLREARLRAPGIRTACLTIESSGMNTMAQGPDGASPWHAGLVDRDYASVPALVAAAGCNVWSAFHRNLTPALVADAHARRLAVLAWTVDEAPDMRRLIDMGVDGIITDYPDRLREVMDEKRMPLP
ncbi:MAG TPA: glycerophosphodiester phosphodiesterase [Casimicrobiaceae bacterium]|nr:glycerophosphodiester phosphodiesterase [Casimicrobiaceae bacterium]